MTTMLYSWCDMVRAVGRMIPTDAFVLSGIYYTRSAEFCLFICLPSAVLALY